MILPIKRDSRYIAGFTLVELMVVMVIIAIMAAYGVPSYQRWVMSGRLEEAKAMIMAIEARQKIYYNQQGKFYPYGEAGIACGDPVGSVVDTSTDESDIRTALGVDLRESRNFKYWIWAGKKGDCNPPLKLDISNNDNWFRIKAEIVEPGEIDQDKADMTFEPEWTAADDDVVGTGPMTEAGRYLIYEYPHRTAANYLTADELVEEGWDNGYNARNIYDETVDAISF